MRRLIVVYNPRSSQYARVRDEVLMPANKLSGYMIGKYEVEPTNLDDNIQRLAKILRDDDLVVSAGGDATGIIASNAVIKSGRKARLAVLPYGNFNDLARTLGMRDFLDVMNKKARKVKYYPLEVYVDGEFFRFATCYVTIGMTAEAVKLYDKPEMRKKLKSEFGRQVSSYTALIGWYFKNRHKKQFIPDFCLNGKRQPKWTSDYAAVNGRYMARVMKGREDFLKSKEFRSITERLANFWRLFWLMSRSIVNRVPGKDTEGDELEFVKPSTVEIQTEGESKVFHDVKKIEIRKGEKWFRAMEI